MSTHVSFDIEILEVECMLPDIDSNDGNVGQERILVRGGENLQALGSRVQALCIDKNDQTTPKWSTYMALTSHPHPEP
jgi:hypothetical protein